MERNQIITTMAAVCGTNDSAAGFALSEAVNELCVKQAAISGVTALASLPPAFYKYRGKPVIKAVRKAADRKHIPLSDVRAELNPSLSIPMFTAAATGVTDCMVNTGIPEECDIVMAGSAGLSGALRILYEKEEALTDRFVPAFLKPVYEAEEQLDISEIVKTAKEQESYFLYHISAGGVFAALWNMADEASVKGMDIDLKRIPIRQETIEICEYLRINPYQLYSAGSVLILAKEGKILYDGLRRKGICAEILGCTTKGNDRIIRNGGELRFLDKPASDELVKICNNVKEADNEK